MVACRAQGLGQEPLRRARRSASRQVEVQGVTTFDDSAVEVAPLSADSDIGLVNAPGVCSPPAEASVPAGLFIQLGPVFLDPPADRRMVHGDSAFSEHLLELSVGDAAAAVSTHCPQDDLTRIVPAGENAYPAEPATGAPPASNFPTDKLCNSTPPTTKCRTLPMFRVTYSAMEALQCLNLRHAHVLTTACRTLCCQAWHERTWASTARVRGWMPSPCFNPCETPTMTLRLVCCERPPTPKRWCSTSCACSACTYAEKHPTISTTSSPHPIALARHQVLALRFHHSLEFPPTSRQTLI